jgi:hypothetical protein
MYVVSLTWKYICPPCELTKPSILQCNNGWSSKPVCLGFWVMRHHGIRSELVGYKSYLPSTGSAKWVRAVYGNSHYRLKSGCWHTHGVGVCEIPLSTMSFCPVTSYGALVMCRVQAGPLFTPFLVGRKPDGPLEGCIDIVIIWLQVSN